MRPRLSVLVVILAFVGAAAPVFAQQVQPYAVPRTEHGQPDFQGVWATAFVTLLERPAGVEELVVSREQAEVISATIRNGRGPVLDPDIATQDIRQLLIVK